MDTISISRIPTIIGVFFKEANEKRQQEKRVRQTANMIKNMPEWQKKDLNIYEKDLSKYKQYL